MRKITKAELLHKLEENGPGVKLFPTHVGTSTIYIRDAMAMLQMMPCDIRPHFSNKQMFTWIHFFTASEMRTVLLICLIDMTIMTL